MTEVVKYTVQQGNRTYEIFAHGFKIGERLDFFRDDKRIAVFLRWDSFARSDYCKTWRENEDCEALYKQFCKYQQVVVPGSEN